MPSLAGVACATVLLAQSHAVAPPDVARALQELRPSAAAAHEAPHRSAGRREYTVGPMPRTRTAAARPRGATRHVLPARQLATAVRHLGRHDPALRPLMREWGPCGLRPNRHYFPTLMSSIVGQQLSGAAADTIWGRVRAHFPGARYPHPEAVLAARDEELRALGLSRAKVASVKDLSAHVLDGRLDLHHLSRLTDGEVVEALVAVRGIGEWTAHMFMMFSLFRLDVLPTGDLGVRKGFQQLYDLPALPKPDEMRAIAEARGWAPYRSVACWYLWRLLD